MPVTTNGLFQIALFIVLLVALAKPLGSYIAMVFQGESTVSQRVFNPVERVIYRLFMIYPAMFVVILGPAIIGIFDALGSK